MVKLLYVTVYIILPWGAVESGNPDLITVQLGNVYDFDTCHRLQRQAPIVRGEEGVMFSTCVPFDPKARLRDLQEAVNKVEEIDPPKPPAHGGVLDLLDAK